MPQCQKPSARITLTALSCLMMLCIGSPLAAQTSGNIWNGPVQTTSQAYSSGYGVAPSQNSFFGVPSTIESYSNRVNGNLYGSSYGTAGFGGYNAATIPNVTSYPASNSISRYGSSNSYYPSYAPTNYPGVRPASRLPSQPTFSSGYAAPFGPSPSFSTAGPVCTANG